jgi:hypothetical protein
MSIFLEKSRKMAYLPVITRKLPEGVFLMYHAVRVAAAAGIMKVTFYTIYNRPTCTPHPVTKPDMLEGVSMGFPGESSP